MEGKKMMLQNMQHGSIVIRAWPENTLRKKYRLFKRMEIYKPDLEDIDDTIEKFGWVYLIPIEHSTRIIRAPRDDMWILLEEH